MILKNPAYTNLVLKTTLRARMKGDIQIWKSSKIVRLGIRRYISSLKTPYQ